MRISDWSSDVCSSDLKRPEIGIITRADPRPEPEVRAFGKGAFVRVARVDKRHDPEIAEPIARLEREFVDAAPAHRIAIGIERPQPLIAVTAYRSAAATIITPRGRQIVANDPQDRARGHPPKFNAQGFLKRTRTEQSRGGQECGR